MKASRWEPVEDEPTAHKSRWENEDEESMPKSKWEREEENERIDKWSKENSENSKWQRVSDSPKDRFVAHSCLAIVTPIFESRFNVHRIVISRLC